MELHLNVTVSVSGLKTEAQLSPEDFEKNSEKDKLWKMAEADPAVKTVLDVFRGKILDVRLRDDSEETELEEKVG
jgi:hypothetical protein